MLTQGLPTAQDRSTVQGRSTAAVQRINESFLKPTLDLSTITIGCIRGSDGVEMSLTQDKQTQTFISPTNDTSQARDAKISEFLKLVKEKLPSDSANVELATAYVLVRSNHTQAEIAQFEAKNWWRFLPIVVAGFATEVSLTATLNPSLASAVAETMSPSAHFLLEKQKLDAATPVLKQAGDAWREKQLALESLKATADDQKLQSQLALTTSKNADARVAVEGAAKDARAPAENLRKLQAMKDNHEAAQKAFDGANRDFEGSQKAYRALSKVKKAHDAAQKAFDGANRDIEGPQKAYEALSEAKKAHDAAQEAFDGANRDIEGPRKAYEALSKAKKAHDAAQKALDDAKRLAANPNQGYTAAQAKVDAAQRSLDNTPAPDSNDLQRAHQAYTAAKTQVTTTHQTLDNTPAPDSNVLQRAHQAYTAAHAKVTTTHQTLDNTPAPDSNDLQQAEKANDFAQAKLHAAHEALKKAPAPTDDQVQAAKHATDVVNDKIHAAQNVLVKDPNNESAKHVLEGLRSHLAHPQTEAPSPEAVNQAQIAYNTANEAHKAAHHTYSTLKTSVEQAKEAAQHLHEEHGAIGSAVDANASLVEHVDHSLHGAGEALHGAISRGLDITAKTLVAARIGSHVTDAIHVIDPSSLPGMIAGVVVQPWFAVVPITLAVARIIMVALKKDAVSTDPMDRAKLILEQGAATAANVAKKHWVPLFQKLLGLRFYDDRPLLFRLDKAGHRGGRDEPAMWLGDRISCFRRLGFYGTCNNDLEKSIGSSEGISADAMFDILNRLTAANAKVSADSELRIRLLRVLALHIVVRRAVTVSDSKGMESRNHEAVNGVKAIIAMQPSDLKTELLYVFSTLLPNSPCVLPIPANVMKLQSIKSMTAPRTFGLEAYGMFMMMLYYENVIMRAIIYQKTKAIRRQNIDPIGAHLSAIRLDQITRLGTLIRDGKMPRNVGACE